MVWKTLPVSASTGFGCVAVLLLGLVVPAAAQSDSRAQLERAVQPIFDRYDRNHDGVIKKKEFMQVGHGDFATMDADKDATISKSEFLDPQPRGAGQLGTERLARAKEMWSEQFTFLDSDKNGQITANEHQAAGTRSFERMDANHDGQVTLPEMMAVAGK